MTNIEGAKPEVEIQEPEGQLYVGADQEQEPEPEQELTNFYNTQGKHRFIYPRVLHKFKFGATPGSSTCVLH